MPPASTTQAHPARQAMLLAAYHAASRADAPPQRRWARSVWASRQIADATADGDMVEPAIACAMADAMRMADTRALDAGTLALKLALLTAELLTDFDGYPLSVQRVALCASALADAVVMTDGGTIELPPGALAAGPEGDGRKW